VTPASTRIGLLSGACVQYDAISYSLRLKLELLRRLRRAGHGVTANVFVHGTDLEDPEIRVRSLRELLLDPEFVAADVLVYEYGIAYDLFDSIFALGEHQRTIGIYHNVTPPELVDRPETKQAVRDGLLRRHNLALLDHVACDSEVNRQDLVACGIPEERLSVLWLPPRASQPQVHVPQWGVDPVEILFVGRLVRAKGVLDLLEAATSLRRAGERHFRVTLAGSERWSEPETIETLRRAEQASPGSVRIVTDPDDAALETLYRASAIFAIPSYHEGYCLPVLEALHAGCQIVGSDAGNLPELVGDVGQVVPTGDVAQLSRAMKRAIEAVRGVADGSRDVEIPVTRDVIEFSEWRERVATHLERHSRRQYEETLLTILGEVGTELGAKPTLAGAAP
jgi:glycosyltransferase involved in cell wall biosynthesis